MHLAKLVDIIQSLALVLLGVGLAMLARIVRRLAPLLRDVLDYMASIEALLKRILEDK